MVPLDSAQLFCILISTCEVQVFLGSGSMGQNRLESNKCFNYKGWYLHLSWDITDCSEGVVLEWGLSSTKVKAGRSNKTNKQ